VLVARPRRILAMAAAVTAVVATLAGLRGPAWVPEVVATSAVSSATSGATWAIGDGRTVVSPDPFAGARLYVDPAGNARREADAARATDPTRAALFDRIAGASQADWFGDWVPESDIEAAVAARVGTIRRAGAVPVLVVYAIPGRDCGSHSAGGLASADAYRRWVAGFARGLGPGRAAVVLEPDALAQLDCLTSAQRTERLRMLADAVTTLSPTGASVYLDAGNSRWHPTSVMAERLRAANVAEARGFALNVSNFLPTDENVAYGAELSELVGGRSFVVDTSRNGLGATTDLEWCNPDGRALGRRPGADSRRTDVDAYLWIKRPGESDGTCNGGPAAGGWWPAYAEGLSSRATW
jgi:endoglucanase